jgi:hypothetical protein
VFKFVCLSETHMSIRTVVEFNHDRISDLYKAGHISEELYRFVLDNYTKANPHFPAGGIRILGTRHHSETLALRVQ